MIRREMRVPTFEVGTLRERVEKVNRRAEKIGVPGFTITVSPPEEVRVTAEGGVDKIMLLSPIVIEGEPVRYGGWTFMGTLDWDPESGLITRPVPDLDVVLPRPVSQVCDHCQTIRQRNMTYLIRSDTGEWKQVGSTCIRDFLGIEPSTFLSDPLADIGGEEDWGSGFGGDPRYLLLDVVTLGAASALQRGYVSRANSEGWGRTATAEIVMDILALGWAKARERYREDLPEITEEARTLATDAIAFALSDGFTGDSDYVMNLKAIAGATSVTWRNIGLAASMVTPLLRQRQREAEDAATPAVNEWLPVTIGQKKVTVTGTATVARSIESMYGTSRLIIVTDTEGRAVKTFGSGSTLWDVREGDTVTLTGTVKALEEWKGRKQTVLTRTKAEVLTEAA